MLRLAISVVLLAACGSSAKGPAWPKLSEAETDGGESLAPQKVSPLAASEAADDDDDDKETDAAETSDDKSSDKSDDASDDSDTSTTPTVTAPEEVINLDDLTIEIDDDD